MNSLNTFLFDLDGTLIDSIELIVSSYRHTLQVHRGTVPPDDVWLAGIGTPLRTQLRQFSDDPAEIEAMAATYREHNLAHHDRMVKAYPGVREALDTIKARGARLGVVTSKFRDGVHRGLQAAQLENLFEVLVGADDVEHHKPHPAPVVRALGLLDADPSRAVFVGDSPHDMAAGRAAGVRTAAVLWGPFRRTDLERHTPDYWLTEPGELATFASE